MTDYSYSLDETLLEVDRVNVAYDGVPILRDVSFTIRNIHRPGIVQGQVDALLAPSGMGKTQLFRTIAGLKAPDSGGVFLNGTKIEVHAGEVGVVAQDYPLFNHLSVMDNMLISARRKIPDRKAAREASLAYLERFGLADKQNHYPHELSGGQRQRVAILQQIVCSNHFLLMDEPYSGLDILVKDEVIHLIQEVAHLDELNSIIITTHDIQAAIASADTILLMGRERDASGAVIPGAYIRYVYDLKQMGLAWHPEIAEMPQFAELEREIKARFKEL